MEEISEHITTAGTTHSGICPNNTGGVEKLLGVAFNKFPPPSPPSPSIHIQFASPLARG